MRTTFKVVVFAIVALFIAALGAGVVYAWAHVVGLTSCREDHVLTSKPFRGLGTAAIEGHEVVSRTLPGVDVCARQEGPAISSPCFLIARSAARPLRSSWAGAHLELKPKVTETVQHAGRVESATRSAGGVVPEFLSYTLNRPFLSICAVCRHQGAGSVDHPAPFRAYNGFKRTLSGVWGSF